LRNRVPAVSSATPRSPPTSRRKPGTQGTRIHGGQQPWPAPSAVEYPRRAAGQTDKKASGTEPGDLTRKFRRYKFQYDMIRGVSTGAGPDVEREASSQDRERSVGSLGSRFGTSSSTSRPRRARRVVLAG
jgi:hypothetical protein